MVSQGQDSFRESAMEAFSSVGRSLSWPGELAVVPFLPPQDTENVASFTYFGLRLGCARSAREYLSS